MWLVAYRWWQQRVSPPPPRQKSRQSQTNCQHKAHIFGKVTHLLSSGGSSRLGLLLLVITGVFIAGLGLGGSGSGLGGLLLVGAVVRVGVGCLGSLLPNQHVLVHLNKPNSLLGRGRRWWGRHQSQSQSPPRRKTPRMSLTRVWAP